MADPQDKKPLNKSDFVRSFPDTVPAGDIVKAAAEKGIVITRLHVNNVRFAARKKLAKANAPSPAPHSNAATDAAVAAPSGLSGDEESLLTKAIERMVEQKLEELFKRRLGDLLDG